MYNKKSDIEIATAADENYAPYLSVMLTSVLDNSPLDRKVHFSIISDGLSAETKESIEWLVAQTSNQASVEFLSVDKTTYADVLVSDHITKTAYLRISLPQLLAKMHGEKVLYLDADILCLTDISELYDQPLNGRTIGAVIDPGQIHALARLGVVSENYYFNSGVMLINCSLWNEQEITKKTIDYLTMHGDKIIYHDQDALNAVLYEKWWHLHPRWNVQTSLITNKFPAPDKMYRKWYEECNEFPALIHFTGHDKPWNTRTNHPFAKQYLNQLDQNKTLMKVGARHVG